MIVIEKWAGLVTNASPYAVPAGGAVKQVNVQVINPGQLVVRNGNTNVSWGTTMVTAASTAATTSGTTVWAVRSVFRCPRGTTERVIYQNASGQILLAQGPS